MGILCGPWHVRPEGNGPFSAAAPGNFRVRCRIILGCGTAPFWYVEQRQFGTRYRIILGCGTAPFWDAVPYHFGTRYRIILGCGTVSFLGAVPYHFWMGYTHVPEPEIIRVPQEYYNPWDLGGFQDGSAFSMVFWHEERAPFSVAAPNIFRARYRIILGCGTASFLDAVPYHFGVRYRIIFGCGTVSFFGAVPYHFGVRYRTILGCGAAPIWYPLHDQKMERCTTPKRSGTRPKNGAAHT